MTTAAVVMRETAAPEPRDNRCQNCGKLWTASQCSGGIRHFWDRVSPGDPVPSGECPECFALTVPVPVGDEKCSKAALRHLQQALELLKEASAPRTAARVRLAISSAKGAIRNAEARAFRSCYRCGYRDNGCGATVCAHCGRDL